jgi:hypothetical protein
VRYIVIPGAAATALLLLAALPGMLVGRGLLALTKTMHRARWRWRKRKRRLVRVAA